MNRNVTIAILIILAMVLYWNSQKVPPPPPTNAPADEQDEPQTTTYCPPAAAANIQMAVVYVQSEICLDGECSTFNIYEFVLQNVPQGSKIRAITGPTTTSTEVFVMGYSGTLHFAGNNGTKMLLPGATAQGDALSWFGQDTQPPNTSDDWAVVVPDGYSTGDSTSLFRINLLAGNLTTANLGVMIEDADGGAQNTYYVNFPMQELTEGGFYSGNPYPVC